MKEQIPGSVPQSPLSPSLSPSLASSLLPSKDIPDTQMAWLFLWFLQETSSFPPQALTSYLLRAENWCSAISTDASVSLRFSLLQTLSLNHLLSWLSDLLTCYTALFLWVLKKLKYNSSPPPSIFPLHPLPYIPLNSLLNSLLPCF